MITNNNPELTGSFQPIAKRFQVGLEHRSIGDFTTPAAFNWLNQARCCVDLQHVKVVIDRFQHVHGAEVQVEGLGGLSGDVLNILRNTLRVIVSERPARADVSDVKAGGGVTHQFLAGADDSPLEHMNPILPSGGDVFHKVGAVEMITSQVEIMLTGDKEETTSAYVSFGAAHEQLTIETCGSRGNVNPCSRKQLQ